MSAAPGPAAMEGCSEENRLAASDAPFVAAPVAEPQAGERPQEEQSPPVELLRLVEMLAAQPTRRAAMECLVNELRPTFAGAGARIIWGNDQKVRHIFDGRLGWLGTESSLWHDVGVHWRRLASGRQRSIQSSGQCMVRLPEPGGRGRALLWLASSDDRHESLERLEAAAPAIAAVLWSRPKLRLPRPWNGQGREMLVAAGGAVMVLVIAALIPVPYRIACTARVEPIRQRIVAAPFEATLLECLVQPGDSVTAEQLLVVLDGRPLRLEMESLQADLQRASKQYDTALATGRIADAQLANLERRQLQGRIELLEQRLAGLEVHSPIAGVVVSGDLRQSVGSPVEMGKALLEIAPLRRMTMEVELPEREIHYVGAGAAARVRLNAAATVPIDGELQRVFPAAEVRDERNVFVGQWEVENAEGRLRPGMRGTAVVYGPRRPLVWPLMRRGIELVLRGIGW